MDWPIYFKDNLIIGNLESKVAVCTLWKKKEIIKERTKDFSVIGNLYSKEGINYILRNLLANPKIRYVILTGPDLSGSGKTFLDLIKYGVNKQHCIKRNGFQLQKEIDLEAIEAFRKHVKVVDLIGKASVDLEETSKSLRDELPSHLREPLLFAESHPTCEVYPSERNAFILRGDFVAEVWVKLLDLISKFGQQGKTEYSINQKEILNVVSVLSNEDPDNIHFVDYFPFKKEDLEGKVKGTKSTNIQQLLLPSVSLFREPYETGYYSKVLTALQTEADYTYGQRLMQFKGKDQLKSIIEKLKAVKYSRRALAVLWDPTVDSSSDNPPCLDLLQFRIINDIITLTAYFRSHDIFRAWPENAFALRKLQDAVAKEISSELKLGELVIISHSAHIYEDNLRRAKTIVEKFLPEVSKTAKRIRDPRGNFYVYVKDKSLIFVNHYSNEGKLLNTFEGKTAKELKEQIYPFISQIEHALYLGAELQKAEMAIKLGLDYTQDAAL